MITIQAVDVKELKQIFQEMFGTPVAAAVPPPKIEVKTDPKKAAAKKEEPKTEAAPPPETITVEIPETGGREATYEEVMERVKSMKATTFPDILERVTEWKTKGGHPALKTADALTLGLAMNFLETLEAGNAQ